MQHGAVGDVFSSVDLHYYVHHASHNAELIANQNNGNVSLVNLVPFGNINMYLSTGISAAIIYNISLPFIVWLPTGYFLRVFGSRSNAVCPPWRTDGGHALQALVRVFKHTLKPGAWK